MSFHLSWRARLSGGLFGGTLAAKVCARLSFVFLSSLFLISPGQAEAPKTPLRSVTLDDVLKIEGFGDARFSPDGRWLIYNQIPPYDQLKDYSYGLYGYIQSGHQLRILDLESEGAPDLHPGFNRDASTYIFGFSPDSRFVVALEYFLGNFQIIACRTGTDDCWRFKTMPDILDRYFGSAPWNERLVWTSNTRFVLPVRDEYSPGSELRSRAVVGRFLAGQWERAWTGEGVTASEVRSTGRDRSSDWAPGQLVEFDLELGEANVLAASRFAGVRLSPDGSELAAGQVSERIRPEPGASSDPDLTHSPFDRRYRLSLIDRLGNARPVTHPFSIDPNSIEWSPDSQALIVFGWERTERAAQGRLYRINRENLSAKAFLTPGLTLANSRLNEALPLTVGPARVLMLGERIAVFARPESGGRYDWYLITPEGDVGLMSGGLEGVSGFPLYADAEGGVILASDGIYRIEDRSFAERLTPIRPGRFLSLAYQANPAHSWSYTLRMTSDLHRLDWPPVIAARVRSMEGAGDAEVVFVHAARRTAENSSLIIPYQEARIIAASYAAGATVVTTKAGASTRLILVRRSGPPLELARINQHLDKVAHPLTQIVSYELKDPESAAQPRAVTGCLTMPAEYEPGKRYPLVIEAYPVGAPGDCKTLRDAAKPALSLRDIWASRGFIHIRPALPLDLARTEDGPMGGIGGILEQTADRIVEQGYADPDQILLYGFSQGGVSALQAATQSDRFAAVISMNGWADYFSHYFGPRGLMRFFHLDQNGGDNRWRYECREEGSDHYCPFGFGTTPLDAPEDYARISPIALAADIRAPVLLIHSDLDYFDMSQYDAMFGALYRSGKEAVYVRYWGEGHGPSSPANMRDLWDRIDTFLESAGIQGAEQKKLN